MSAFQNGVACIFICFCRGFHLISARKTNFDVIISIKSSDATGKQNGVHAKLVKRAINADKQKFSGLYFWRLCGARNTGCNRLAKKKKNNTSIKGGDETKEKKRKAKSMSVVVYVCCRAVTWAACARAWAGGRRKSSLGTGADLS